jgi:microsomal epoxide hydrolase
VIEPFVVDVPDATLADLRDRLSRTRFPNEIDGIGWEQGTPLGALRDLVRYWRDEYDWRAHEARLNSYDNFVSDVDGQRIHFLHVQSPHPDATPLLLVHGWPGSIVEFLDAIEPLTDPPDPADAFSLVVPSLPGYAFSAPTRDRGWNPRRIAAAFGTLMEELGYERYGVQGGDWGSIVVANLADLYPDRVVGLHLNLLMLPPAPGETPRPPSESGRRFAVSGSGYQQIQSTKPQTVGYGLEDSPAGLAAWIYEKFAEWSDCGADPESVFTRDQLLTNIMLYWVNAAATSSARLYWEMREAGVRALPQRRVSVPTGVANFPNEIARCERAHAERRYDVVHWTEHERGGHFAAMEQPAAFVEDVRTFFRAVRS